MDNYKDVELFSNGPTFANGKEFPKNLANTLIDDSSGWVLVKVPIKHEFIDELTETIKYEWRYRLYLSTLYKRLGLFDSYTAILYSSYYWERDKNGNITELLCTVNEKSDELIDFSLYF